MGEQTRIGWATHSWSPWRGCSKVSDGCKFCYAEALSRRNPAVLGTWGPDGARVVNRDWNRPLKWDRVAARLGERHRVFPSLCDPFEDREDLVNWRIRFLDLVARTPHLDWLILTKRPAFAAEWLEGSRLQGLWPLPNAWLGVSAEDQATADERIPILLDIPAAVRFVSCEPLLGPIRLDAICAPAWQLDALTGEYASTGTGCLVREVPGLDWVIVGGESGPKRRPMELAWLGSIVRQCHGFGVNVPCYVKQDSAPRDGQQGRIPHHLWSVKEFPRVPVGA